MYSFDIRKIALNVYNQLRSLRKTSKLLNISHSSINRWFHRIERVKYERQNKKMTLDVISIIKSTIFTNPLYTLRQLKNHLKSIINLDLSVEILRIALKKLKFTRKNARFFGQPKYNDVVTNNFIAKRNSLLSSGKRFISIDEVSFGRNNIKIQGYSIKGTKLYIKKQHPRISTISVIASCDNKEWISLSKHSSSINTDIYLDYIKDLELSSNDVLMMDNVKFHHSKKLKEYLQSKNVEILYIPPYSPWFNPIELCFSKVKRHYYKDNSIDDSFNILKKFDFINFFNKSIHAITKF